MTTLEILDRLISFDTTSRGSNLALIGWVEAFLHARGIETHRVANSDGTKANLYAIIGPHVEGGVILSGHTDVVPVDGQAWSSDPFTLTHRDARFYGRGVADMKSFLAACLAHVDTALAADLQRPIILAFSYDEEVGCLGAPAMIAELAKILPTPRAAIVGEPTSMQVVSGHKGISTFIVTVTGREAHSSQIDQGVSAIMEALPLMQMVADMAQQARSGGPFNALFDPPHATMTIGMVNGGTAVNILARSCEFVWDLRCPPGDDPERYAAPFIARAADIDASLKARASEAGVTVTRRSSTPPFAITPDSAAEQLARRLTGDNQTRVASYAAEAGLFQKAGFPTVLCGPGNIAQAHQPDEWIDEAQITHVDAWMQRLIETLR